jgi:hypothetical protein
MIATQLTPSQEEGDDGQTTALDTSEGHDQSWSSTASSLTAGTDRVG